MFRSVYRLTSLKRTSRANAVLTNNGTFLACWRRHFQNTGSLRQIETESGPTFRQKEATIFNIHKVRTLQLPINESTIKESNVDLNDLELCLANGEKLTFNLTWLRDSCHCKQCTHEYSRQRLFTVRDFRQELFGISEVVQGEDEGDEQALQLPRSPVELSPQTSLKITWANGHESVYLLDWLRYVNDIYKKSQLNLKSPQHRKKHKYPEDDFYLPTKDHTLAQDYWNLSKIESKLTPIDYADLIDGFKFNNDATFINANRISDMSDKRFKAMLNLINQLVTLGLAKIINVPKERNQVLNVARSLAYERPTGYGTIFDVVVEPSEEINLAYSSLEFDLHSDLTYREMSPGVQLLHCIRDSTEGGLSYFSDAFNAAKSLRETDPDLFEVLLQFPATFVVRDPYRNTKFRRQQPVISLDYQGKLNDVYYSPFMLPPVGFKDDVKLFYLALDKFTQLLQSKENKAITKMNPGDLFIFHNRRVLHGRSAYNATTSGRFLQGCYMDWDEIKCLHEKLHSYTGSK